MAVPTRSSPALHRRLRQPHRCHRRVRHVIDDEYAHVVPSVEPDLTLRSGSTSHIWRETKTRGFALRRDEYEGPQRVPGGCGPCDAAGRWRGWQRPRRRCRRARGAHAEPPRTAGSTSCPRRMARSWSMRRILWRASRRAGHRTSRSRRSPVPPAFAAPCTASTTFARGRGDAARARRPRFLGIEDLF